MDFAGARLLFGYERQLLKKLGLTLGLHAGYAFGGPSSPSNTPPANSTESRWPRASSRSTSRGASRTTSSTA